MLLNERDPKQCVDSRGLSEICWLSLCNDVRRHLKSLHISREIVSKVDLIVARVGMLYLTKDEIEKMEICPYLVQSFWRPSKRLCHHPSHTGVRNSVKGSDVVNILQMCKDVQKQYWVFVPLGAHKCIIYFEFLRTCIQRQLSGHG
jgi:hypothetical protein